MSVQTLSEWLHLSRDTARTEPLDLSVAAADARFADFGTDPAAIPSGDYCYFETRDGGLDDRGFPRRILVLCPFYGTNPDAPDQQFGYCALLRSGDWMEDGTMLLFDHCKECGKNPANLDDQ